MDVVLLGLVSGPGCACGFTTESGLAMEPGPVYSGVREGFRASGQGPKPRSHPERPDGPYPGPGSPRDQVEHRRARLDVDRPKSSLDDPRTQLPELSEIDFD